MPVIIDAPWGKVAMVDRLDPNLGIEDWHSLVHHCLDVAACMRTLLQDAGYDRVAGRIIGRPLNVMDMDRIAAWAFMHDIGKGNSLFQRQVLPGFPAGARPGHLLQACALLNSQQHLPQMIAQLRLDEMGTWLSDPDDIVSVLGMLWSHHGKPVSIERTKTDHKIIDQWSGWKWATFENTMKLFSGVLNGVFSICWDTSAPTIPMTPAFQHWLCGLLQLADWMASDNSKEFFPYSEDKAQDASERYQWSRGRARSLVLRMGLGRDTLPIIGDQGFQSLFGFAPRSLQRAVEGMDIGTAGTTYVFESETGSGKTEAALLLFARLYAAGLVDGIYVALPTRTSGVQIHRRVDRFVDKVFAGAVRATLAIPGYLTYGDNKGFPDGRFSVRWGEGLAAPSWFAETPKRFLSAPVSVGTVDQAMQAAIRVKHAHMRGTSLSRNFLVIDEVHASDEYMSRICARLVRRHAALGGSSLLMSATLGAAAASKFSGEPVPSMADATSMPYPRIIVMPPRPHGASISLPVVHEGRTKRVSVEMHPDIDDVQQVAEMVAAKVRQGAKVLVIRNTVKACIETRQALADLLPVDRMLNCNLVSACHHGRYAPQDRKLLDVAIEVALGYGDGKRHAGGCAVMSTQTAEQSLDIDADLLVTDLCPMDVLLQRIGRLHRAEFIARPDGFLHALCIVLVPASSDGIAAYVRKSAHGIGLERAYDDVRKVECTRRLLLEHPLLAIPEMNRMLVEGATHGDALSALEREDDAWKKHGNQVRGRYIGDRSIADASMLDDTIAFAEREIDELWQDVPPSTRLGAASVSVKFEPLAISPFGGSIGYMSVPRWMVGASTETDEVTVIPTPLISGKGFSFGFAGKTFTYDADGLHTTETSR